MAETPLRQDGRRERPLVAVVCSVPLVAEAVRTALEFAELAEFPERGSDVVGLLKSLRPAALVVDSDEVAMAAAGYAREHALPVLHISLGEDELRVFRAGAWQQVGDSDGATPEALRSIVAGALFARVEMDR